MQKMILGMEILLHTIPKVALMLVAAAFLGVLPLTLAAWLPFACIRRYASGLHAKNSINCAVACMILFVAVPYLLQSVNIDIVTHVLAFVVTGIILYKYAPADTESRPIIGKKKRARLKKEAVIANFVLLMLSVFFIDASLYLMVSLGVVSAAIHTLPLLYKLLGRRTNNYEQYESKNQ